MATEVITFLIDDIDGTKAAETVRFALDRTEYEIDLSEINASGLRKALAEFITHARRASGAIRPGRVRNRGNTEDIRAWAASVGITVAPRGRIPAATVTAYRAAHKPGPVPVRVPFASGFQPAAPVPPEPAPDGSQEPAEPPAGLAASDEPGNPQEPAQSPGPAPGSNEAIRAWAASAGREVKPRGRIPSEVKADYWQAMREGQ